MLSNTVGAVPRSHRPHPDTKAGVAARQRRLRRFRRIAPSPPGTPAMTLKQQLTDDMKAAMRGGDKQRLGVIRLVLAAIKQREVDERIALDDAQTLTVLEKMLKQR